MLTDRAIDIDLDGEHGSIEPFAVLDDLADRARVAFVGEMEHFIQEKYDFRLLCIRYLAARGWRWFGEEWDAARGRRVDEYLRTGVDALLEPIDEPPWFTGGILANDRQPTDLLEHGQRRFYGAVRRAVPDARWFGFDCQGTDREYIEQANAADTVEALRPAMATRERIMHANVARVLDEHEGEKVALMAAAQHLVKDDDTVHAPGVGAGPGGDRARSLGHHVARELTTGPVLSLWLLHGEGTSSNPWLPPHGRLAPAAGTFDAELAARIGRSCLVPVGDDHHRRSVTGMHGTTLLCRFSEQVDAIVFAPEVSPLREAKQPDQ